MALSFTNSENGMRCAMMKDTKTSVIGIKCDKCGKVIPITNPDINYPTDYVWKDGRNLCLECNKKEGMS